MSFLRVFARAARRARNRTNWKSVFVFALALGLLCMSALFLWVATLQVPTLDGFEARQITQSTKIYDRTGKVLLFDLHDDVRRTVVPLDKISRNLKNATIAIEDSEFYTHKGVRPLRVLKAVFDNITTGDLFGGQGGSTITQQVVKNSLLTPEKTISRKVKEWILAIKLEHLLTKDQILELYLNEAPYGGNIYGAEEASQYFFGVSANDLTLAQAAYLAALPQAPSRYSPYGGNRDALDARKNLVLLKMRENGFITDDEYRQGINEEVIFSQYAQQNIKAPHFVFFVRQYLEEKYGHDAVFESGLKVITTLNYDMQKEAEDTVSHYALINERDFNAENAALVAIDPHTGQILAMVGSRDYFDETIDGKYNVATALRQPGSTFKPIVYATAFEKGYTPETVVFDVPTQFSTACEPNDLSSTPPCYAPVNYDDKFRGPMTLRNALAQSINIPAIKMLYLAGLKDSLQNARDLGITSLSQDASHYGSSLVLGGGEVSLLELTGAYAALADNGVYHNTTGVLRVEDASGNVLEEYTDQTRQAVTPQAARLVTDILSDNEARAPSYGQNNFLVFPGWSIAGKTGTTNDFRDVWVVGYTPTLAVGTWAGNNDNSPIVKKVAGFVIAPMWRAFMNKALTHVANESFAPPAPEENSDALKPVMRGDWQGGDGSVHSILYWVNKDDPRGPSPANPASDPQFSHWEYPVRLWAGDHNFAANGIPGNTTGAGSTSPTPTTSAPYFVVTSPTPQQHVLANTLFTIRVAYPDTLNLQSVEYYLDGVFMGASSQAPFSMSIIPQHSGQSVHTLRAVGKAGFGGNYVTDVPFFVD